MPSPKDLFHAAIAVILLLSTRGNDRNVTTSFGVNAAERPRTPCMSSPSRIGKGSFSIRPEDTVARCALSRRSRYSNREAEPGGKHEATASVSVLAGRGTTNLHLTGPVLVIRVRARNEAAGAEDFFHNESQQSV